jgi:glycosyltransferase involved in cell wall biosynthesis
MENNVVTVLTTTYNHSQYIRECLEGIVNQKTSFKFQLIICDDCSTDNTREIIEEYKEKYPEIIKPIYNDKNYGAMGNFAKTLNEAHTKYVALCDGDDYWCDDTKLQQQYDFLEKHKDYNIVFHKTKIFFEDNSREEIEHPINIKSELTIDDLIEDNMIPANSVMYRWKYKKKDSFINDFPDNIAPGDFYVHLAHAKTGKIHFIDKVMSRYRRQQNGMWWLTSQPDKINDFYNIYGEKYLRFFTIAEEKFKLKEDAFKLRREWVAKKTASAYLIKRHPIRFLEFYKKNKDRYGQVIDEEIKTLRVRYQFLYYLLTKPLYAIPFALKKILGKSK